MRAPCMVLTNGAIYATPGTKVTHAYPAYPTSPITWSPNSGHQVSPGQRTSLGQPGLYGPPVLKSCGSGPLRFPAPVTAPPSSVPAPPSSVPAPSAPSAPSAPRAVASPSPAPRTFAKPKVEVRVARRPGDRSGTSNPPSPKARPVRLAKAKVQKPKEEPASFVQRPWRPPASFLDASPPKQKPEPSAALSEDMKNYIGDLLKPTQDVQEINCLRAFWREALSCPVISSLLASEEHIDKNLYWEKRRVQNHLRRLLEEIQERLGLEQEAGPQDLDAFFGRLASVQCLNTPVVGREMAELDLSQILEACQAIGA
ncbi:unnamed protein product [Effrenium voratum]|nr:unnamed protein product [Effrenium voratum]